MNDVVLLFIRVPELFSENKETPTVIGIIDVVQKINTTNYRE